MVAAATVATGFVPVGGGQVEVAVAVDVGERTREGVLDRRQPGTGGAEAAAGRASGRACTDEQPRSARPQSAGQQVQRTVAREVAEQRADRVGTQLLQPRLHLAKPAVATVDQQNRWALVTTHEHQIHPAVAVDVARRDARRRPRRLPDRPGEAVRVADPRRLGDVDESPARRRRAGRHPQRRHRHGLNRRGQQALRRPGQQVQRQDNEQGREGAPRRRAAPDDRRPARRQPQRRTSPPEHVPQGALLPASRARAGGAGASPRWASRKMDSGRPWQLCLRQRGTGCKGPRRSRGRTPV